MAYTDEQIKAARRALSGQDEEPVVLRTSAAGGGVTDDPHAKPPASVEQLLRVDSVDVLAQLQRHDPQLCELLALRAINQQLKNAVEECREHHVGEQ